uniref:Uncharacterized protein n=1 Tax=Aegilops tauschii subsp. strangulata TaxID=200361 RepID=A0A452XNK6_AEGTS
MAVLMFALIEQSNMMSPGYEDLLDVCNSVNQKHSKPFGMLLFLGLNF